MILFNIIIRGLMSNYYCLFVNVVFQFNLFSFYEKDHGYRDGSSLMVWANDMLHKAGINHFSGSVFLQAFPRVLGYGFLCFWSIHKCTIIPIFL